MLKLSNINGLGTLWWFELFDYSESRKEEANQLIKDRINEFEQNYSRFNEGSYIGQLNAGKTISNPPKELVEILKIGLDWYTKTSGVFNLITGHIQEEHGYGSAGVSSQKDLLSSPYNPHEVLIVNSEKIELREGKIDLGGYGKGYLIDKLAKEIKSKLGITQFLINGGGDMFGTHKDNRPIEIHIEHPTAPGRYIAKIPLFNSGLGVSSSYKRAWENRHTKNKHNHLVDPSDTEKFIEANSITISPSALQADVSATLIAVDSSTVKFLSNEITDYCLISDTTKMSTGFKTHLLQNF